LKYAPFAMPEMIALLDKLDLTRHPSAGIQQPLYQLKRTALKHNPASEPGKNRERPEKAVTQILNTKLDRACTLRCAEIACTTNGIDLLTLRLQFRYRFIRFKLKHNRVHAEALSCWGWSVVKEMAEVCSAPPAQDFSTLHPE
jgi:hypothetical protein